MYLEIHDELAKLRYEGARSSGVLRERTPSPESLRRVEQASKGIGESHILSLTDKQILALALDLKTEGKETMIVTEDYSIQNMSQKLEITFQARGTRGIRKEIHWIIYCPGCKKLLIERSGYTVLQNQLKNGNCPTCGKEIYGVWK